MDKQGERAGATSVVQLSSSALILASSISFGSLVSRILPLHLQAILNPTW